ncbi:MAG: TrbC/VirB2 family protein, partial [Candidatus Acidiferrum sp.]
MKPTPRYPECFRRALRPAEVLIALLVLASPVLAQAGASPWENAVSVLQTAFTSTIARGLSLVAVVVAGLTFAFARSKQMSATPSMSLCTSNAVPVGVSFPKSSKSTAMIPTEMNT